MFRYHAGMKIRHPVFGVGTIQEIIGTGTEREVKVLFPAGEKRLGLRWADEKCRLLSRTAFRRRGSVPAARRMIP